DGIESGERRLGADHRLCAAEIDLLGRELQRGITAECDFLADSLDEPGDAVPERSVEVTDGIVVDSHRRQARRGGAPPVAHRRLEAFTVRLGRALGTLE